MQRPFHRLLIRITAIYCLLLTGFVAMATDEYYGAPPLKGNQVAKDSTSTVTDTVYFNPSLKPLQTTFGVKNLITFKLDESYRGVLPNSFSARIVFRIQYTYDVNGTATLATTSSLSLDIGYVKDNFYWPKAIYTMTGGHKAIILIDSVYGLNGSNINQFREALVLTNEITVTREYSFSCTNNSIQSIFTNTATVSTKGELTVSWQPERAADEYDLEWSYIDSAALSNYVKAGQTNVYDPKKIFTRNATRVSVQQEAYSIPLLYEAKGHLFYRVRAVQVKRNKQRIESAWSSDYTNGMGKYDYVGLDDSLNWQASTSFAEEGKRKSVVQYFDGSLKSRQTVTKDNTTDTTIVAETLYDYQGRPVIQVMPSPSLSSLIKYTPGFNKLNGAEYDKDHYDGLWQDSCYCKEAAPRMDTFSGAARYYSPQNPLAANGFHKYIPDAKGFVFAETRYTPDNTGRISMQGGVGEEFRIGKGHETQYSYSKADQEELDALFGTEVGNTDHYFKNTVRDANGQYSISYVDMHGRTIATALAGRPVSALDTLASNRSFYITKQLLDSHSNVIKGTTIESSNGLVVTKAGAHRFRYSLLPDSISIVACDNSTICYDCIYDLEITITDECNNTSFPNGQPIVIKKTNYQLSTACDSLSFPIVDDTVFLKEGSYLVTKTLTINQQAMEYYRDSIFMVRNTCKTLEQTIEEQKQLLKSRVSCAPVSCDTCRASLGTWEAFHQEYMAQAGFPVNDTASKRYLALEAWNKRVEQCDVLCDEKPLDRSIRSQMLADVTPPYGQYADTSKIDLYSVFWTAGNTEPAPYTDVTNEYVNELGQNESPSPRNFNKTTFVQQFKPSWAETLLEMHPEYEKLKKYETWKESHAWDTRFENTDTYQAAVNSGFLNPGNFSSHPSGSIFAYNSAHRDPFFTDYISDGRVGSGYKTAMQDSLLKMAKDNDGNRISMWSLATIMAHCADSNLSCLYTYKPDNMAFALDSNCGGDLDMAWRYFRAMYQQEKREIIANILHAEQVANGRFPNLQDLFSDRKHYPNFYDPAYSLPDVITESNVFGQQDSLNTFIDNNCAAYVEQWWQELKPCGYDSTDKAAIIPLLIQVCREGGDENHLFGASTVKPGSNYPFKSFEAVLKYYNDSTGKDYDATCNVYLITAPKPYDQQPIYYDKPVFQKPDSCECATIALRYQEYQASSDASFSDYLYRTTGTRMYQGVLDTLRMACNGQINCSFLKEPLVLPPVLQCGVKNVCVKCVVMDTLLKQYKAEFPDALPAADNNDSLQQEKNALFERYMNTKLGFGKQASEYLTFMDSCGLKLTGLAYCDTVLQKIKYDYLQKLANDSSHFTMWQINQTNFIYKSQVYRDGVAHVPDQYVATEYIWYDKNDTLCTGNVFTIETRYKRGARATFNTWNHLNIYVQDNLGYALIGPIFRELKENPTASDTAAILAANGEIGYGRDGTYTPPNSNNFIPNFLNWTVIKVTHGNDSIWRVYMNDTLISQRYIPTRISKITTLRPIFRGPDHGYVDYFKVYDQDGVLRYVEEFEDHLQSPSNDPDAFRCPGTCDQKFANYFNQRRGTNYTYHQIDSLYWVQCGIRLNICDTVDTSPTLCGKTEPVFAPIVLNPYTPCADSTFFATNVGTLIHDYYTDSIKGSFSNRYLAKCLNARYHESFTVDQPVSEYHYTLYYYDQAGNLVKTIPPQGVDVSKLAWARQWSDSVSIARRNKQVLKPQHALPTQYRYNTLNQVVASKSPDGGLAEFWYDRLGRLAISRNAKQKAAAIDETGRQYSYTLYDVLGRITEVGQLTNAISTAMADTISRKPDSLATWITHSATSKEQITQTVYDLPYTGFTGISPEPIIQHNLRNRVSYTTFTIGNNPSQYNQGTFYSYDIHGNVDTLLQDYGNSDFNINLMNTHNMRFKTFVYDYDLISGKVNRVQYQPDYIDGWIHRYSYDAENRLTQVETSPDGLVWEKDARYEYYRHGPLARTVLGDQQVQGTDYAYTLQGWLKGVNSVASKVDRDMGNDAMVGSSNQYVAQDVTGFSLNYFTGDYTGISGFNPFPGYSGYLDSVSPGAYRPLFNGNISSMARTNSKLGELGGSHGATIFYNYGYDQLNRLTQMDAYNGFNTGDNDWKGMSRLKHWMERIAYDANGNILKYKRNGAEFSPYPDEMDSLHYDYYAGTNQLKRIRDSVPAGVYPNIAEFSDLDGQVDSNYVYDEIGNLIKDSSEKITNIKWSVYGKILQITKQATAPTAATRIIYSYDAQGNRISKTTEYAGNNYKRLEWYVRDAQGNVMAIYFAEGALNTIVNGLNPTLSERHIYGSSLLGTYNNQEGLFFGPNRVSFVSSFNYVRGLRRYQLSNHLGNVEAVITDKKYGVPSGSNSSLIEYYKPDITMVQDFYPFGWPMPGRTWETKLYRYGFNGKETENDVKGKWNSQDYGMRVYDPRVGRFLSVDPLTKSYPMLTPYQFASNRPIDGIDLDGCEYQSAKNTLYVYNLFAPDDKKLTHDQIEEYGNNMDNGMRRGYLYGLFVTTLTTPGTLSSTGWGLRPLLTRMTVLGATGATVSATISFAKGDNGYDIVKSTVSGFIGGAALGMPWTKSLEGILVSGGVSGSASEIINQVFDNAFGKDKGYSLERTIISGGVGSVANYLSSSIVDKVNSMFDKQLVESLAETQTTAYRETIKKAILEKTPRIGTNQLKTAINNDIKKIQALLRKQTEINKAAAQKAIERGVDVLSDQANQQLQPAKNN